MSWDLTVTYLAGFRYGRDKQVILQAADADNCCALACGLAAAYLWAPQKSTTLPPRALICLTAANCNFSSTSQRTMIHAFQEEKNKIGLSLLSP